MFKHPPLMQQTPAIASHWTSPKPKICDVCFCNLTKPKINPFSEGEKKIAKTQRGLIKKQLLIYQYWYEHVKPHREFLAEVSGRRGPASDRSVVTLLSSEWAGAANTQSGTVVETRRNLTSFNTFLRDFTCLFFDLNLLWIRFNLGCEVYTHLSWEPEVLLIHLCKPDRLLITAV